MRTIKFVPPRVPLTDPRTGMVTREWYLLFEQLFSWKMGDAETDAQLLGMGVQGVTEGQLLEAMQELRQLPIPAMPIESGPDMIPLPPVYIAPDDVSPVLGLLRDEIAELRKAIEGLEIRP